MASFTKRPKTPTIQQFIPQTPTPSAPAPQDSAPSETEIREQVREESLLRRSRGRLGTVFTGFKGLLAENEATPTNNRKTLLGE